MVRVYVLLQLPSPHERFGAERARMWLKPCVRHLVPGAVLPLHEAFGAVGAGVRLDAAVDAQVHAQVRLRWEHLQIGKEGLDFF